MECDRVKEGQKGGPGPCIAIGGRMTQVASEQLFMLYSAITLLEQIIGAAVVIRTLLVWSKVYNKLTPVVKSYILVFVPDVVIVVTYLARSIYGLLVRKLVVGEGDYWFCALSAYLTIAACIALCTSVVCISYTVLRVLQGNPVPEKTVMSWGIAGWIIGFLLATIFSGNGLLGPYKNLYCLVDQGLYRGYGTAPVLITVFGCFSLMVNNYVLAFSIVREAERRYEAESDFAYANKASRVVLRNGITVIGTFYISWFLIFLNAFITAAGGTVPVEMDVVASLLSKFQPIADSLVLHQMLHKIAARYLVKKVVDDQTADPKKDTHVLRRAVEKYTLKGIPEEQP